MLITCTSHCNDGLEVCFLCIAASRPSGQVLKKEEGSTAAEKVRSKGEAVAGAKRSREEAAEKVRLLLLGRISEVVREGCKFL